MASLKEASDADLSSLRRRMTLFNDSDEWATLKGFMLRERERILKTLADDNVPGEKLKVAQGELNQANRDIMLVERFLDAITREQERRDRKEERR